MRLIVLFLILIAAGALAVGAFVYIDAGYVMLSWENYTVETSLWMFLVLGAIALLAVYIALRALLVLFGSDRRFNEWRQRRRSLRARRQTTRGLLALAQGQWRRAENTLQDGIHETGVADIGNAVGFAQEALLSVGKWWHVAN